MIMASYDILHYLQYNSPNYPFKFTYIHEVKIDVSNVLESWLGTGGFARPLLTVS